MGVTEVFRETGEEKFSVISKWWGSAQENRAMILTMQAAIQS